MSQVQRKPSPSASFRLPLQPSDQEIERLALFDLPLVKQVPGSNQENAALSEALSKHVRQTDLSGTSALHDFLKKHPEGAWSISLNVNLGLFAAREGRYSLALQHWQAAWGAGKEIQDPRLKAQVDRAAGELLKLQLWAGRQAELGKTLQEIGSRPLLGVPSPTLYGARRGLKEMERNPEGSFHCGTRALVALLRFQGSDSPEHMAVLYSAQSSPQGFHLGEMMAMSRQVGMDLLPVHLEEKDRIPVPSILHLKLNHFVAVLKERDGRLLVEGMAYDGLATGKRWIRQEVLKDEMSGFVLVDKEAALAHSARVATVREAKTVHGSGFNSMCETVPNVTPQSCTAQDRKVKQCPPNPAGVPMAQYNVHAMLVNLTIFDEPLRYQTAFGPAVSFVLTYNHKEPLATEGVFANVGKNWNHNWLGYVLDDPAAPGQPVRVFLRGGGYEDHSGYNASTGQYALQRDSQAVLKRVNAATYWRILPDGSKEVYGFPDLGSGTLGRKIFLTEIITPDGLSVSIQYDSIMHRIARIVDAAGLQTTFSYESSDPFRITRVTDPFGRSCQMEYNASGYLSKITDIGGIQSSFAYDATDPNFISSMTTPYGTTTFAYGEGEFFLRWLEVTDPEGRKERTEFIQMGEKENALYGTPGYVPSGVPSSEPAVPEGLAVDNNSLWYRNTYFWSKKAMHHAPGDYSKAKVFHWLCRFEEGGTSAVLESEKEPFETRVYYNYPGQAYGPMYDGGMTLSKPSAVARLVPSAAGTGLVTALVTTEYNSKGLPQRITDPVGRQVFHDYASNGLDLVTVRVKNASGGTDVMGSWTYDGYHRPLSHTDAAGQTTRMAYNAQGQPSMLVDAGGQTNIMTYYPLTDPQPARRGRLASVGRVFSGGNAVMSFEYDNAGNVSKITDEDGFQVQITRDVFDRPLQVAYPDSTAETFVYDRLDMVSHTDRAGRKTDFTYNSQRQMVQLKRPMGGVLQMEWCLCGSLSKLADAKGQITEWIYDEQGRVIQKRIQGQAVATHSYDEAGRLKDVLDSIGQTRRVSYNADGTVAAVRHLNAVNPTPDVFYEHDAKYGRLVRALSVLNGLSNVTAISYHPYNLQPGAGQVAMVDGPLSNDEIAYQYDGLGRVVGLSVGGTNNSSSYGYDDLNRLAAVTNNLGAFSISFDGASQRPLTNAVAGGIKILYQYHGLAGNASPGNGDFRLKSMVTVSTNGSLASSNTYDYFTSGQISRWHSSVTGGYNSTQDFVYDANGRLAQDRSVTYTNDPSDNMVSRKTKGLVQGGRLFDNRICNSFNQMTQRIMGRESTYAPTYLVFDSTTCTYDGNGNLVAEMSTTYTNYYRWDAENRLVQATSIKAGNTNRTDMSYDALGQRNRLQDFTNDVAVSERFFVWDGSVHPVEERTASGQVLRRHYPQGFQAIQSGAATNYLYVKDHLGSIRAVVTPQGAVLRSMLYEPYGVKSSENVPLGAPASPSPDFGFAGMFALPQQGLYLTKHRPYSLTHTRWISRDPIGESGGINLYAYCLNDPVNFVDSWGMAPGDWWDPRSYFNSHHNLNEWADGWAVAADGYGFNNAGKFMFGEEYASFGDLGYYNPCDSSNQVGLGFGNVGGGAMLIATGVQLSTYPAVDAAASQAVGFGLYGGEYVYEVSLTMAIWAPWAIPAGENIIGGLTPVPPANWTQFGVGIASDKLLNLENENE